MYYEPDTIWGRTIDGDREIAAPRSGLSVTQRRVLKQLAHPRTLATIAARHRIDPPKLEHDLIALAQLQLVAFQRPGATQPRTAPRINLPLSPVDASPKVPAGPPLPLCFAAAALGILAVLLIMT